MTISSTILSDITEVIADWGDSATWTHSGVETTISGIFENEYFPLNTAGGDISSGKPAFICATADVPGAYQGDTLLITSELFSITEASYTVTVVETAPSDLGPGLTRMVLRQ